jgi:lysozyme
MQMSAAARHALVETFEGLRDVAYRDCAGVLTVGYGHTTRIGPPVVTPGLRVSPRDADAILARDLARVEAGIATALRVQPTPPEFDALVDFAYNVGLGALRSSSLLRAFNRGDKQTAAEAFLGWAGCGGRRLPGLLRRREAERAWFLGRVPPPAAAAAEPVHKVDHPDSLVARARNRVALLSGR